MVPMLVPVSTPPLVMLPKPAGAQLHIPPVVASLSDMDWLSHTADNPVIAEGNGLITTVILLESLQPFALVTKILPV